MNERVLELAKQAGLKKEHGADSEYIGDFDWREFAELIVRECISTIENAENGYQDYRNQIEDGMRNHCISLIKNEFGVEE